MKLVIWIWFIQVAHLILYQYLRNWNCDKPGLGDGHRRVAHIQISYYQKSTQGSLSKIGEICPGGQDELERDQKANRLIKVVFQIYLISAYKCGFYKCCLEIKLEVWNSQLAKPFYFLVLGVSNSYSYMVQGCWLLAAQQKLHHPQEMDYYCSPNQPTTHGCHGKLKSEGDF